MTPQRLARLRSVLDRRQPDLTVLMENVHKPHNFSAVLRTCDAVGVLAAHAVTRDGRIPRFRLTSGGSSKWVQVKAYDRLAPAVETLRAGGFQILAAHLHPEAIDYREADYTKPTCIVLGQEKDGVSEEALAAADGFFSIPMRGMVASLNVSVAAAVILYEAERQRAQAGLYETCRIDEATYQSTLFEWAYPELAGECRRAGRPYPRLDDDGELLDPVPA